MLRLFAVACVDEEVHLKEYYTKSLKLQTLAMHRLIQIDTANGQRTAVSLSVDGETTDAPCYWRGVKCADNGAKKWVIQRISWDSASPMTNLPADSPLDFRWLPAFAEIITISQVARHAQRLETRLIPRTILQLRLDWCKLYGSIDFFYLPREILKFIARNNNFSGTIQLSDLPESIREVNIQGSAIAKVLFRKDELAEKQVQIIIGTKSGDKEFGRIKKIR